MSTTSRYGYNPNRAGENLLKFCAEARKTLIAALPMPERSIVDDPQSWEERFTAIAAIKAMDHRELRAALDKLADQAFEDAQPEENSAELLAELGVEDQAHQPADVKLRDSQRLSIANPGFKCLDAAGPGLGKTVSVTCTPIMVQDGSPEAEALLAEFDAAASGPSIAELLAGIGPRELAAYQAFGTPLPLTSDAQRAIADAFGVTTTVKELEHHRNLLAQALGECIAAAGITDPAASLDGPQLLMFAEDLKRMLQQEAAERAAEAHEAATIRELSLQPAKLSAQQLAAAQAFSVPLPLEDPNKISGLGTILVESPADEAENDQFIVFKTKVSAIIGNVANQTQAMLYNLFTDGMTPATAAQTIINQRVADGQRFTPRDCSTTRVRLWVVYDESNQQDVFSWYGPTGQAKCEAVAAALNSLGHGKD